MQALTAQAIQKQTAIIPTENGIQEVVVKEEPYQYKTVWRVLDRDVTKGILKTDYPYVRYPSNMRNIYYVLTCPNDHTLLECEYLIDKLLPDVLSGKTTVKVSDLVIQDASNKFYTLLSYNQGTYKNSYLLWNDKLNRFVLDIKK
jgi:hypothetical protein